MTTFVVDQQKFPLEKSQNDEKDRNTDQENAGFGSFAFFRAWDKSTGNQRSMAKKYLKKYSVVQNFS